MSSAQLSASRPLISAAPPSRAFVPVVFALWFALAFWLGRNGWFVTPQGTPPFPILIAVLAPISLFVVAYFTSRKVRDLVLTADVPLITSLHAFRFVGFSFLGFYAAGLLPGRFAWPAALGDMAIAVTAPFLARAVLDQPKLIASRVLVGWNLFGIADFIVAVGMGAIAPLIFPGARPAGGAVTILAQLPLSLIPTYFVPMFTIFHVVALIRARHAR